MHQGQEGGGASIGLWGQLQGSQSWLCEIPLPQGTSRSAPSSAGLTVLIYKLGIFTVPTAKAPNSSWQNSSWHQPLPDKYLNYYHPCPNPTYLTLRAQLDISGPGGGGRGEGFFFFSKLPQNISPESHDIKLISQYIVNRFYLGYSSTWFSLPLGEMVSTQLSERPLVGVGYI